MTFEQKLIELAKMDGFEFSDFHGKIRVLRKHFDGTFHTTEEELFYTIEMALDWVKTKVTCWNGGNYYESHDAIIPLIQKIKPWKTGCAIDLQETTPSRLSDALLKAKGFEV